ncbi:hypothetical protein phiA829_091 [Aeromonas phage phiA8-29]|uniref:Uncharacterized protein n=1 Tax=Aeromonas phage phiA8-29 TaxID=1978922 RepID=A0A1W6DYD1_9CAUD|nr:hypothetical protein HWB15_gp092 [Aeromonas phage phiA8-29]ARK07911.1 hypothetical protein phiA829_091 [Aeromonas phage phiA8-29]
MRTKILMTKDNPEGQKLEELLRDLQYELALKTLRLAGDGCEVSNSVSVRNVQIMDLLAEAQLLQEQNMKEVEEFFKRPSDPTSPRMGAVDNTDSIGLMIKGVKLGVGVVGCFALETKAIDTGVFRAGDKLSLTPFGEGFYEWFFDKTS